MNDSSATPSSFKYVWKQTVSPQATTRRWAPRWARERIAQLEAGLETQTEMADRLADDRSRVMLYERLRQEATVSARELRADMFSRLIWLGLASGFGAGLALGVLLG